MNGISPVSTLSQNLHSTNEKLIKLTETYDVGTPSFKKEIKNLRNELNQRVDEVNKKLLELSKGPMTSAKLQLFTELSVEVLRLDNYVKFLNEEISVQNEKEQAKSRLPRFISQIFNQSLIKQIDTKKTLSPFLSYLQQARKEVVAQDIRVSQPISSPSSSVTERLESVAKNLSQGEKAWVVEKQEDDSLQMKFAQSGKISELTVEVHAQGLYVKQGVSLDDKGVKKFVFDSFQDIIKALGEKAAPLHQVAEKQAKANRDFFDAYQDKFYPNSAEESGLQAARASATQLVSKMDQPTYYLAPSSRDPEKCSEMTLVTFEPKAGFRGTYIQESQETISLQNADDLAPKLQGKVPLQTIEEANKKELAALKAKFEEIRGQAAFFVAGKDQAVAHINTAIKLGIKGAVAIFEDQGVLYMRSYGQDGIVRSNQIQIKVGPGPDGVAEATVARTSLDKALEGKKTIGTIEAAEKIWTDKKKELTQAATKGGYFVEEDQAKDYLDKAKEYLQDKAKGLAVLYEKKDGMLHFDYIDENGNKQERLIKIRVEGEKAEAFVTTLREEEVEPFDKLISSLGKNLRPVADIRKEYSESYLKLSGLRDLDKDTFDAVLNKKDPKPALASFVNNAALLNMPVGAYLIAPTKVTGIVHAYVVNAQKQIEKYEIDTGTKPGTYVVKKEEPRGSGRFIDHAEYQDLDGSAGTSLKEKLGFKLSPQALQKQYEAYKEKIGAVGRDKDFVIAATSPEAAADYLIGHTAILSGIASGGWLIRAKAESSEDIGVAKALFDKIPELQRSRAEKLLGMGKPKELENQFVLSVLVAQDDGTFELEEHAISIDPATFDFVCDGKNYKTVDAVAEALEKEKLEKAGVTERAVVRVQEGVVGQGVSRPEKTRARKWLSYSEFAVESQNAKNAKGAIQRSPAYHTGSGQAVKQFFSQFRTPYWITHIFPHQPAPHFADAEDAEATLTDIYETLKTPTYVVYQAAKESETVDVIERIGGRREAQKILMEKPLQLSVVTPPGDSVEHYTIDIWKKPGKFIIKELGIEDDIDKLDARLKQKFSNVQPFKEQWGRYRDNVIAGHKPTAGLLLAPGETIEQVTETREPVINREDQGLLQILTPKFRDETVKQNFIRLLNSYNDLVKIGSKLAEKVNKRDRDKYLAQIMGTKVFEEQRTRYKQLVLVLHPDKNDFGAFKDKALNLFNFLNACGADFKTGGRI